MIAMDSILDIKKRNHEFIDHADERILRIINAIITTVEIEEEGLTAEHKEILDQRLEEHRKYPTSGKSWIEVKQSLKKQYGI